MATEEKIHMEMPAHPGGFIKHEVIEPLGLKSTRGAEVLGVTGAALFNLLNEKAALSSDMRFALKRRSAFQWKRSCAAEQATTLPTWHGNGKGKSKSPHTRLHRDNQRENAATIWMRM